VLCTSGDGNHQAALRANVHGCVWEVASSASLHCRRGEAAPLVEPGLTSLTSRRQRGFAALLNCRRRSSAPSTAQDFVARNAQHFARS